MNRHERRARAKDVPDGYLKGVYRLDRIVRTTIENGYMPRFAFPPKDVALFAGLDQIGHTLARNEAAHAIITLALDGASIENVATYHMLAAVLEKNGVEVERVGLSELGISPTGEMS